MKASKILLHCTLFSLLAIACGKNAFLESSNGNERIINSVDGVNPDTCPTELYSSIPVKRDFVKGEEPFHFQKIRINESNDIIISKIKKIKSVKWGQVILDYDLSKVNHINRKIKSIELELDSKQYIRSIEKHIFDSQICHNQNYVCSGNKKSVIPVIKSSAFEWVNDFFSKTINSIDLVDTKKGYKERTISTSFDLMPMFKKHQSGDLRMNNLTSEYTIFISDRHLVSRANLNIVYCK